MTLENVDYNSQSSVSSTRSTNYFKASINGCMQSTAAAKGGFSSSGEMGLSDFTLFKQANVADFALMSAVLLQETTEDYSY